MDGGSRDGTSDTARFLGADRVLNALPGRAHQMDAGYRVASGEIVLFLHADTRLEVGWYEALREAMLDPISAGGAFTLRFEAEGLFFRLLERGALWRSRKFGLPYGDQALFLRRKLLMESDGIAPVALFEDLDLARQISGAGELVILPQRAFASARRYQRNGALRQWWRNQLAVVAWASGLDRERVAAWYRRGVAR